MYVDTCMRLHARPSACAYLPKCNLRAHEDPAGATEQRKVRDFPWRGGPLDKLRSWLLSQPFQVAAQLAGGKPSSSSVTAAAMHPSSTNT